MLKNPLWGLHTAAVLVLATARWGAAQATPPTPLQSAYLAQLHPRLEQSAPVENATLQWQGLQFSLARGRLDLAAPVKGQVSAAVFEGQGELRVEPPDAIEAQQMKLFRGRGTLVEPFTEAIFRFADGAAFRAALGEQVHFSPATPLPAMVSLLEDRAGKIEARGYDDAARLLQASKQPAPGALLSVMFKTADGKWVEADSDPLQQHSLQVAFQQQRPRTGMEVFTDVWTRFSPTGELAPSPWRLGDYDLSVAVPDDLDLHVKADFTVSADRATGTGLVLVLDSNLRVTAATLDDGATVGFLQPKDPGREPDAWYEGGWLYLQLPRPLEAGAKLRLHLEYHGKHVIESEGQGNFFCRSFGWYPTVEFGAPFQRADFELHFSVNRKYTVVATGEKTGGRVEGNVALSDWRAPKPLTVAGFALGDYRLLAVPLVLAGGQKVTVQVYNNNQMADDLKALSLATDAANLPVGDLDPKHLGPLAAQEVGNALRFMTNEFGPYPYATLAVTPIPGAYGQGWPGLLYLSSLSFLDTTALHTLGVSQEGLRELSDTFRAHETSHQWWGHQVSWATPGDQWLSEGFADASAILYEQSRFGNDRLLETLQEWRRDLLQTNTYGRVAVNDGALTLGYRLTSTVDPDGFRIVGYEKGAYVLYMLRQLMRNNGVADSDAEFRVMMHDFTSTYANRDAATADFQRIAEKYMDAAMDLDHNHRLDWFFNQYVYGTGFCHLTFHAGVVSADPGQYKLTMTVDNPEGWRGLLPVYMYRDKNTFVRGLLRVDQPHVSQTVPLDYEPSRVVANAMQDMLVEVKQ